MSSFARICLAAVLLINGARLIRYDGWLQLLGLVSVILCAGYLGRAVGARQERRRMENDNANGS